MLTFFDVLAIQYPRSHAVLTHTFGQSTPDRTRSLREAYARMPPAFYEELEREIGYAAEATGRGIAGSLQDLDIFNSMTDDVDNDSWYEQPRAFTSMHLDAMLLGFSRRRLDRTCNQALRYAGDACRVMEVGCGSGRLSEMLADARPAMQLTLIDRSIASVQFTRRMHELRGTGNRVAVQRGDLHDIPAPDDSFDLVIAAEVLEHAVDADASIRELLRVLRPGGHLVVSIPIDLDIAMHPVVFRDAASILTFLGTHGLVARCTEIVRPDAGTDAIADVFPGFPGCLNAALVKLSA